jgi:hypothetical protein
LLPVFDISYCSDKKYGSVIVRIKTMRRNLMITLEGSDLNFEKLHAQVVIQSLK